MYQKMGLVKPFAKDNPDVGRKAITGNDFDKFVFKVPTLRNDELTYPYFHDGSVWDLEEAVAMMADLQLGQRLTKEESGKITEFLIWRARLTKDDTVVIEELIDKRRSKSLFTLVFSTIMRSLKYVFS